MCQAKCSKPTSRPINPIAERKMTSIKDVALHANVSVKTVSRILSGNENVSEKTRKRVAEAMQALEYYPSAAAQALRGQETGIVCLITERLTTTPDSFDIIAGIQHECEQQGKLLMIGESGGKASSFEKLVNDFRRQRAQAIIFATVYHREVTIEQSFNKCPLILVNCFEKQLRHPTIIPDDESGAYEATLNLLKAGHTRIAFLTLFEDMPAAILRLRGYKRAHMKMGIEVQPELIHEGVCRDPEDEFATIPEILRDTMSRSERPSAIMCGNDKMAMRVYMLIRRMGYKIPETISIVGYDNYRMIAENLVPKLTTVSLPYFQMGQKAAQLALTEDAPLQTYLIGGEQVIRGSVAPPGAG